MKSDIWEMSENQFHIDFHSRFWGIPLTFDTNLLDIPLDVLELSDPYPKLFPPDSAPDFRVLRLYSDDDKLAAVPPRVIVRDEYTRASNYITEALGRGKRGLLITGQPGIGKTVFLWYLLALRLSEQKPSILAWQGRLPILYTNTGVYELRVKREYEFRGNNRSLVVACNGEPLVLIDADHQYQEPPIWMVDGFYPHVQISSPNVRRYKCWYKQFGYKSTTYLMNPWRWSEIVEGLHLQSSLPVTVIDTEWLRKCFEVCGPVPRQLYATYLEGDTDVFQSAVAAASARLTVEAFTDLMKLTAFNTETSATSYDSSHLLTLWWRQSKPGPKIVVSSRFVMATILQSGALRYLDRQRELILLHSANPFSATWAEWLFESFAAAVLQAGGVFPLVRLHRHVSSFTSTPSRPSRTTRTTTIQKKKGPELFPELTELNFLMSGRPFRTFDPKNLDATLPLIKDVIYLPALPNNPAFDAVMLYGSDALIFQMTLNKAHSLSDKGLPILRQLIPSNFNFRFILVVPDGIKNTAGLSAVSKEWIKAASFHRMSIDVKNVLLEAEAVYSMVEASEPVNLDEENSEMAEENLEVNEEESELSEGD